MASLDNYTLMPGAFGLGWTLETVSLPITSRLAARVEGKSGLARLGLGVHLTAPTIHAGFKGQIQLEMANCGPHEIILNVGMRICQLIFETYLRDAGESLYRPVRRASHRCGGLEAGAGRRSALVPLPALLHLVEPSGPQR